MNSISRGWLFIILFAGAALLFLVARGYGGSGDIRGSVESETTNPGIPYAGTATAPGGSTEEPDERPADPGPTRNSRQPVGSIYSTGEQILPLAGDTKDLDTYVGDRATARAVPVQSVDADEGFWVGTEGDRVWVQLVGPPPESPYQVRAGDSVSFTGTVVEHDAGFAATVGVNRADGSRSLTSQGAHIEVRKSTLTLAP
ncbi:hypothetical protein [Kineosporia sp. NBRC 101731]|uniref:hypothetical protein n=1 Tax=Kineosporia sp. NBRC 101731 TaxID=3032199 RepID=UPI0024A1CF68|nr:hypothetical protein [Kineosporia sp. NBRC 101731]GLY27956.1 hypothetical protein Kisp02_13210 [Kineosporia sp. NBRC 101731]